MFHQALVELEELSANPLDRAKLRRTKSSGAIDGQREMANQRSTRVMNDRSRDTGPVDLPAELRDHLADLRGDLLWGRLTGSVTDAGWLACELIEADLDTPAVGELTGYTLSIGSIEEVEPLVRQVLAESGFPPIDLQREPWAVAHEVAQGMAEGTLPIGKGADFLILELGDGWSLPAEIWELILLIDDWEALRATPPSDDELRQQARKIADAASGWRNAKADQEP